MQFSVKFLLSLSEYCGIWEQLKPVSSSINNYLWILVDSFDSPACCFLPTSVCVWGVNQHRSSVPSFTAETGPDFANVASSVALG